MNVAEQYVIGSGIAAGRSPTVARKPSSRCRNLWRANVLRLLLAVALAAPLTVVRAADVTVAAASSFVHALPEVGRAFEGRTGHRLRVSYGASGNLARQILQGAPFDVFLSANRLHTEYVESVASGPGQVFALGRLAAYFNIEPSPEDLSGLVSAYRQGRIARLAIANPEHAPYGFAAREVLESQGLWESIGADLVFGENVAQAAQFAATGSVDAALVALSLLRSGKFPETGRYFVVPANRHRPIQKSLILLARSGPAAREFAHFLSGPEAASILTAHGFEHVSTDAVAGHTPRSAD